MTRLEISARPEPDFADLNCWRQILACPLCEGRELRTVVWARDRHYGNPGSFATARCERCGLQFLNPMPTDGFLSTAYPDDYYAHTPIIPKSQKARRVKKLKRLLRYLLYYRANWTGDPQFKTPGAVLDIGSGAGTFLAMMREKGWRVCGVEPDLRSAERGREEGMEIFGGTIDAAHYPPESFDYVRSNHSFEHITNPREVLREVRRIIKPNGYLFIGVPNICGLMARVWGTYWWYLGAPVHTFGYCPATLGMLLEQEGFRVERVSFNSSYAGIFGSLQVYLYRNSGTRSEEGWMIRNQGLRVIGYWLARVTDILKVGDCMEVIARPI
jgi:SAM-dependent methyltransferase